MRYRTGPNNAALIYLNRYKSRQRSAKPVPGTGRLEQNLIVAWVLQCDIESAKALQKANATAINR